MVKTGIVVVAALGLLAGAWLLIRERAAVVAGIPARPELASAPGVLRERVEAAEARARGWLGGAKGLGELAGLYHANGFLAEARVAYQGLLDVDDDDPRWHYRLADIVAGYGQLEEALPSLRRAVELAPNYEPARVRLDQALAKLNRSPEVAGRKSPDKATDGGAAVSAVADPWLEEVMMECYDPYRLRVAAAAATDGAAAERLLTRAIQVAPGDAASRRQLGDLLTKRGDYGAAREHLQRAVELAPKEADNWAYLLRLLELAGDTAARDQALASGLANCPQSPSLHLEHGRRLKQTGKLNEALVAFETSRRLRPQEPDAHVEIAVVCFRLNRVEEGIAALRGALAVEPAHPVALSTLAFCAIGIGDEAMARQALRDAREQPRVAREDLAQLVRKFGERFGRAPW